MNAPYLGHECTKGSQALTKIYRLFQGILILQE